MADPTLDVIEHLVAGIVEHPDDVDVRAKQTRRGELFEVRVNPDDLGKVIGRQGRTATAIRRSRAPSPEAARASTSWTSIVSRRHPCWSSSAASVVPDV